ncbi:MAG: hypothetical protein CL840_02240 [Crocinitomicaceae bacterium]|nr:hypothetical protein [Crocinitomicaceae bacterium]|tara:strand:+ start:1311 stop:2936 length:1626 start_codon:yes stop_codon:yes gene_type:complete
MRTALILSILLSVYLSSTAQDKEVQVDSKIEHVTVFLSGAQVERSAKKTLRKGVYHLNFNGLSNNINPNSVQVGGNGDFTILSVSSRKNYFNPVKDSPKYKSLKDSLEVAQNELWYQQEMKRVYQEEQKMILANKQVGAGTQTGFDIKDVQDLANLYRSRLSEIMKLIIGVSKKETELQESIRLIQNQMNQLAAKNMYTSEVLVEVAVDQTIPSSFELKYMVHGASWSPNYDIRANGVDKPLELVYNAQVVQNTGIDWKGVDLSLSTNNPHVSPIKPDLTPWRLGFITVRNYGSVGGKYDMYSNRKTEYNKAGADLAEDKVMKKVDFAKAKPISAAISESDLNFSFEIPIPYNIPSDGNEHKVNMKNLDMKANFNYYTVPKKKQDAYLVASVSEWEQLQLMSGSANIYLDGTFVGKSFINAKSTEDTLNISLGVDKQIVVSRKRIEDFCKSSSIGSKKTETIGLEVMVKNTKMTAVKLVVEEQIPISSNKEIVVELEESSGAEYDEKTGFLTWPLELGPGESKKVVFKYSVKFPKDKAVNL